MPPKGLGELLVESLNPSPVNINMPPSPLSQPFSSVPVSAAPMVVNPDVSLLPRPNLMATMAQVLGTGSPTPEKQSSPVNNGEVFQQLFGPLLKAATASNAKLSPEDTMSQLIKANAFIERRGKTINDKKALRSMAANKIQQEGTIDPITLMLWVEGGSSMAEPMLRAETQITASGMRGKTGRTVEEQEAINQANDARDFQRALTLKLFGNLKAAKETAPDIVKGSGLFDGPERIDLEALKNYVNAIAPMPVPLTTTSTGRKKGTVSITVKTPNGPAGNVQVFTGPDDPVKIKEITSKYPVISIVRN